MFKPELLSPAGTLKNMRYAFAHGADAGSDAGQPRYSLRVRNNEFNHAKIFSSASMKPTRWGKSFMSWSTLHRTTPS